MKNLDFNIHSNNRINFIQKNSIKMIYMKKVQNFQISKVNCFG